LAVAVAAAVGLAVAVAAAVGLAVPVAVALGVPVGAFSSSPPQAAVRGMVARQTRSKTAARAVILPGSARAYLTFILCLPSWHPSLVEDTGFVSKAQLLPRACWSHSPI
jgi:uncharacterized transporter YbjL